MRRLAVMVSVLAVLFGTGIPTASAERPPAAVALQNNQFEPKEIAVQAGDQVMWTNNDKVDHTVTSDNDAFDSNPSCGEPLGYCMGPGDSYTRTYAQRGTYTYHCKVHGGPKGQGMSGTVTVN